MLLPHLAIEILWQNEQHCFNTYHWLMHFEIVVKTCANIAPSQNRDYLSMKWYVNLVLESIYDIPCVSAVLCYIAQTE